MLDYCVEHGIVSDIELIDASQVNTAYDRVVASDVKYRFVIDVAKVSMECQDREGAEAWASDLLDDFSLRRFFSSQELGTSKTQRSSQRRCRHGCQRQM
jgi:hypothetical protein